VKTPKAFANFSPGFERSENPGEANKKKANAESVRHVRYKFSSRVLPAQA